MVPITGIIGTNPIPRFVDLKLASDEVGLKEARSGDTCCVERQLKSDYERRLKKTKRIPSTLATDKESAIY